MAITLQDVYFDLDISRDDFMNTDHNHMFQEKSSLETSVQYHVLKQWLGRDVRDEDIEKTKRIYNDATINKYLYIYDNYILGTIDYGALHVSGERFKYFFAFTPGKDIELVEEYDE